MKRPIYWLSLMLVMLVTAAAHAVGNNALVVHPAGQTSACHLFGR